MLGSFVEDLLTLEALMLQAHRSQNLVDIDAAVNGLKGFVEKWPDQKETVASYWRELNDIELFPRRPLGH